MLEESVFTDTDSLTNVIEKVKKSSKTYKDLNHAFRALGAKLAKCRPSP